MSADSIPNSPDFDTPPPIPPEMGHSGTEWDEYPSYELSDLQFRAIELTVQGLSDTQIAQMLSIDRKTLWRWKSFDEEYRRALTDAREQIHAAVSDRYRTLLMRATSVMAKFLEDPVENNRFRASHALLMMAGCFKPLPPMALTTSEPLSFPPPPELPPKVG
jgi:hypothetical protein